jgi:putative endonuclease
MFWVYILRDAAGRHYYGMTSDLVVRLEQHRSGGTQTTRRMNGELTLVASCVFSSQRDALIMERKLKNWKNPAKAIAFLNGSKAS